MLYYTFGREGVVRLCGIILAKNEMRLKKGWGGVPMCTYTPKGVAMLLLPGNTTLSSVFVILFCKLNMSGSVEALNCCR